MGGRVGRWCAVVLAGLISLALFGASSATAQVEWVTKQIGWASGGGAVQGGTGYDTTYVTDEADTNKTVVISTRDWAWDVIAQAITATTATQMSAYLTLTAQQSNGTADTCYAIISPGYGGTYGAVGTGPLGTRTTGTCAAVLIAGNAASPLVTFGPGSATTPYKGPPAIVFQGPINFDSDTRGVGNAWLLPEFVLTIVGDVGGTAPKLSGCRLYLTYPKRVGSR